MGRIGVGLALHPFVQDRAQRGVAEAERLESDREIAFLEHILLEALLIGVELVVERLELSIAQLLDDLGFVRSERRSQNFQRTTDAIGRPLGMLQKYHRHDRRGQ